MLPAASYGVHAMETVETLRAKAQQCWRLIYMTEDRRTCAALKEMAEELEAAADLAEDKTNACDFLAKVTVALKPAV